MGFLSRHLCQQRFLPKKSCQSCQWITPVNCFLLTFQLFAFLNTFPFWFFVVGIVFYLFNPLHKNLQCNTNTKIRCTSYQGNIPVGLLYGNVNFFQEILHFELTDGNIQGADVFPLCVTAEAGEQRGHAHKTWGSSNSGGLQAEENHHNRSHFRARRESPEAQHR